MEEFKSNSHKSKEENKEQPEKKVEKVISGKARTKEKSGLAKAADVFISEDVTNVKSYILMDVLIPAIKKGLYDIVTNGLDMILYGETGHSEKRSTASKVSYRSYYDQKNRRDDRPANHSRSGRSNSDVIFESRGEAEAVLARMDELVDTYGLVSVADLYDLSGVTSEYTDNKYGWTDVRNASIARVRDGYVIKMPRAMPLN